MAKKKDEFVKVNITKSMALCKEFSNKFFKFKRAEKVIIVSALRDLFIIDDEALCQGILGVGMETKIKKLMGGLKIGNRNTKDKKGKARVRKAKK